MSFWVYLHNKEGKIVEVDNHTEGGTYSVFGTDNAELNITYNYSKHYYEHLNNTQGLRYLHEKKAKEVISDLERTVKILGTKRDNDYWNPTEGNAGYALNILLEWAKQNPDAIFIVD